MLTREIIARVINLFSRGLPTEENRLTPRHVYNKLLTVRARLISEQIKKKQKVSQWNYQTLSCVELIQVDKSECVCLLPSGCMISRTKHKLPKPLTSFNSHVIQSVTNIMGDQVFSEVSIKEKKYKSANKYTAKKPDFYIKDGYLYLTHITPLKVISVIGLFENPEEVKNFPQMCPDMMSDGYDACDSVLDREFPIDLDKIDVLIELTLGELAIMFGGGLPQRITRQRQQENNNEKES